ncbi:hypothetical protein [Pseudoprimorskyibacter insulae]|nr:hypothetical protein [Pseudoprimorskyibacter insulae]
MRRDRGGNHMRLYTTASFVWTWVVLKTAGDPAGTKAWLMDRGVPQDDLQLGMAAIAAALTVSFVLLIKHILTGLLRARGYYDSGAILMGFAVALTLQTIPTDTYRAGYNLIGDDAQEALSRVQTRARDIDWTTVINTASDVTTQANLRGGSQEVKKVRLD